MSYQTSPKPKGRPANPNKAKIAGLKGDKAELRAQLKVANGDLRAAKAAAKAAARVEATTQRAVDKLVKQIEKIDGKLQAL